jgi:hypothetical protein
MSKTKMLIELERIIKETTDDIELAAKVRALGAEWFKPKQPKEQAYPTIDLLNSEGPILLLKRTPEHFLMYDEWKFMIARMRVETLLNFIDGKTTVRDTHDRVWKYTEQSEGMKPKYDVLMEFIEPLIEK